tara:strand:+ start:627 stop:992 length:366 start_codon:yes stop_codon:yes gene_type:complete
MVINKVLPFSVFIFCLLISLYSYSDEKIPTIKEYLNDESGVYDSYIYGLESGLEWAAEYYFRKHGVELYCKPGDIELPSSKLKELINTTIDTKPGFFKKYENEKLLGLALRNGYIQAFPCQ